jgi:hypothetical protein
MITRQHQKSLFWKRTRIPWIKAAIEARKPKHPIERETLARRKSDARQWLGAQALHRVKVKIPHRTRT